MTEPVTPPAGGEHAPTVAENGSVTFTNMDSYKSHSNTNYRDFVDSEWAQHPSTANLNTLNDVIKSSVHAQQMVGVDKIAKPNEKWGEDDWKQFYRAGGMPETEDGYQVGRPADAPENFPYNPEEEKTFKSQAYQNGLSVNQANALWTQRQQRRMDSWSTGETNNKSAQQEGWTKLKSELGATFDAQLKGANSVLARFDQDGSVRQYLQAKGMIDDPTIARFVMRIAENFKEDTIGTQQSTSAGLTPKQYRSKAREIQQKMRDMTRGTFEHEQALDQYKKLQALAAGGE